MASDAEIIYRLKSGYAERIRQEKIFYDSFTYFINEGCKKYHLSSDDSFSAYSDAVMSALHNIIANRFDGKSSLKTYLFKIFSNKCVDLVRRNTTIKRGPEENTVNTELLVQMPDHTRSIVERLIDNQKVQALKQQLETIGEKCKEILLLSEDGLTDKEIADELNYNNAAVAKTTRLRCLEKLREKMTGLLKIV